MQKARDSPHLELLDIGNRASMHAEGEGWPGQVRDPVLPLPLLLEAPMSGSLMAAQSTNRPWTNIMVAAGLPQKILK